MEAAQILARTREFSIGKFSFSTSYLQALAVIALSFLLILSLASFRRHLIGWSIKGALFGLFFGFLLALIFEGFLIIGGKTAVTEILGWKNAPKPLVNVIDAGRAKLVNVLGVTQEIPSSVAKENPTTEDAVNILQSLDPVERERVRSLFCAP
ncbi:MAG: hypothetical protein ACOYT7_03260 [Patescibacteria group bacterium]